MQTNLHVHFNGQCEAAFRFYERCLGGKTEFVMYYEGSPAAGSVPPDWRDKVLHARLRVGGQVLMACDAPPTCYETPKGFSVSLQVHDPEEAERIFHELAEEGQIRMPLQETFWARRFGLAVDRFGIPWMVNCEKALQNCTQELEETPALAG
ncbi:Glyoxalase/bleomycin resistance protein/dioxygenase [Candidatus Sulfopaludibacter sp. SbA3]|nr:Glyoxalase/bleomycin resistance protein/dioxygenase [Candidatus Sulfopaludibacter sp. SbA3]